MAAVVFHCEGGLQCPSPEEIHSAAPKLGSCNQIIYTRGVSRPQLLLLCHTGDTMETVSHACFLCLPPLQVLGFILTVLAKREPFIIVQGK